MENLIENYSQNILNNDDYYNMLKTYAESHKLTENEKTVCWIDEAKDPKTNQWSCREILKDDGWKTERGGFERGKDYNHSAFCDHVLGGLLGIKSDNGNITGNPKITGAFKVDNLWIDNIKYTISYSEGKTEIIKGETKVG